MNRNWDIEAVISEIVHLSKFKPLVCVSYHQILFYCTETCSTVYVMYVTTLQLHSDNDPITKNENRPEGPRAPALKKFIY